MSFTDTSPAARDLQLKLQRAMTDEQRLLLALEMSIFARKLERAVIQSDHPDWSDAEVARELIRRAFLPGQPPAGW